MNYFWKIVRLIIYLAVLVGSAFLLVNGILLLLNAFTGKSISPLFTLRIPEHEAWKDIDITMFSDIVFGVLNVTFSAAFIYRTVYWVLEEIQFFNADFHVLKRGKIKLNEEEIHSDLLPSSSKIHPQAASRHQGEQIEDIIPQIQLKDKSSHPRISSSERPTLELPNEPTLKADMIGSTLDKNEEMLKESLPPMSLHDEESVNTSTSALKTEPESKEETPALKSEVSEAEKISKSIAEMSEDETPASKEEKEEVSKMLDINYEDSGDQTEAKAEEPTDEDKKAKQEQSEDEFLTSLSLGSLFHFPWSKKKKAKQSSEDSKDDKSRNMDIE